MQACSKWFILFYFEWNTSIWKCHFKRGSGVLPSSIFEVTCFFPCSIFMRLILSYRIEMKPRKERSIIIGPLKSRRLYNGGLKTLKLIPRVSSNFHSSLLWYTSNIAIIFQLSITQGAIFHILYQPLEVSSIYRFVRNRYCMSISCIMVFIGNMSSITSLFIGLW